MTTLEILKAARKLIEKPENWSQGCFARTESGNPVWWLAPNARMWCAVGAIWAVAEKAGSAALKEIIRHAPGYDHLSTFNDLPGRTHAQILALFDRAIEACGEAA